MYTKNELNIVMATPFLRLAYPLLPQKPRRLSLIKALGI